CRYEVILRRHSSHQLPPRAGADRRRDLRRPRCRLRSRRHGGADPDADRLPAAVRRCGGVLGGLDPHSVAEREHPTGTLAGRRVRAGAMTLTSQSYRLPGHAVHEYELTVPLDPAGALAGSSSSGALAGSSSSGALAGTITVFAREFVRDGGAHLPRLVWFQGGPGARADRPTTLSGWLERALEDYRVVLLDQRGTGRSTPADAATIPAVGSPAAQAEYLACLRADSIVADAEALRRALQGDEPWTALGQSYGGFITTCYLSQA